MGRIIRHVPENWEHPKKIKQQYLPGRGYEIKEVYRPMHQQDYKEAVKERKKEIADWFKGHEYWQKGIFWSSWDGEEKPVQEAFKEWIDDLKKERKKYKFDDSYRKEELRKYETGICTYEDVAGKVPSLPNPDDYMPLGTWIQLFENVSEGTPLSPPFKTAEELITWLTNNKDYWGDQWTKEQAEAMVKAEYSPSFVMDSGKLYTAQEALVMK